MDTNTLDKFGKRACDYAPQLVSLSKVKGRLSRVTGFFRMALLCRFGCLISQYSAQYADKQHSVVTSIGASTECVLTY